jgi:hypothetical protein
MSSGDRDPKPPSTGGFWQWIKSAIIRTERDYSFLKGLTVLSLFGTLIGAYFQNLSAYENKVAAQAQADMTAATQTFAEVSSALASPLRLQRQLISDYHAAITAGTDGDADSYETADAYKVYRAYRKAYADLSQSYNLLARKAELYIDLSSDLNRNPSADGAPSEDEIDMSLLNAYGFDCETNMPSFDKHAKDKSGKQIDESKIELPNPQAKKTLTVDWYSTKHHVLAIETCFEITHEAMTPVHQWASGSAVDAAKKAAFIDKTYDVFSGRASNQVLRLNAFMALAMFDIDKIRIKYRPNGFVCSIPGLSEFISLFGKCTPLRTSSPLS